MTMGVPPFSQKTSAAFAWSHFCSKPLPGKVATFSQSFSATTFSILHVRVKFKSFQLVIPVAWSTVAAGYLGAVQTWVNSDAQFVDLSQHIWFKRPSTWPPRQTPPRPTPLGQFALAGPRAKGSERKIRLISSSFPWGSARTRRAPPSKLREATQKWPLNSFRVASEKITGCFCAPLLPCSRSHVLIEHRSAARCALGSCSSAPSLFEL